MVCNAQDVGDDDLIAWDDMKDRALNPSLVRIARLTEMKYVGNHKVYDYAKVSEGNEKTGAGPVGTKLLVTNKGDDHPRSILIPWVVSNVVSEPLAFSTVTMPFLPTSE